MVTRGYIGQQPADFQVLAKKPEHTDMHAHACVGCPPGGWGWEGGRGAGADALFGDARGAMAGGAADCNLYQ